MFGARWSFTERDSRGMRNKSCSPPVLINLYLQSALSFSVFLMISPTSAAQNVRQRDVTWIWPVGAVLRLKGCEVKEESGSDGVRKVYIKRDGDEEWIPFYVDERTVGVALGYRKQLVLINDCPATKFCKVMAVDLASRKSKQIDLRAIRMYRRNVRPDNSLIIIPQAYAFSPDDKQVLVNMEHIYTSVSTAEMAAQLSKTYKNWWYIVDSTNGRVLREYRTSRLPPRWWLI
jgi:hypothetical protein